MKLPEEVLEALRSGRIEYTKAKAIAQVKDEASRLALLEDAIASSLSLSEIRARVKALNPPTDPPPFASRIETISKLVKKHHVWNDPKKRKKLETLLAKIEELISSDELDESQTKKESVRPSASIDQPSVQSDRSSYQVAFIRSTFSPPCPPCLPCPPCPPIYYL